MTTTTATEYRQFSSYEEFIYLSRYARWIEEEGRREQWPETIDRVIKAFQAQTKNNHHIPWEELRTAMLNRDVMPSMRVMMTAGKALDLNHIALYNCAFTDIDSLESFSEILYILMHGTGVGFSVKKESMSRLPFIERKGNSLITLDIEDSKEGWRDSVLQGVGLLAGGYHVAYDYSKIRAAGERLKTFGGRASGPAPLVSLHEYIDRIFTTAGGRRLTTAECHGIVCKIAEVVVVGGVRRSALISLSDLDDKSMAEAKTGEWWVEHGEYALANNSAVYETKPTEQEWNKEWGTIVASGSGERGIVNMLSAKKKCKEIGRDETKIMGTNPCGEILLRNGQFCNLSEVVIRPEDTQATLLNKVALASIIGTIQSTFDNIKGLSEKWITNTKEERLLGVSLTGIMGNTLTNGKGGELKARLASLRSVANNTNVAYARILGIPKSASVTTVKPSGTVSQLCGVSSGIHPAHASSYIRRVRNDKKDPLTQLMIDAGVPGQTDFYNKDAHVFEFGIDRSGECTRDDFTAVEFLEIWLTYKKHWTDHNPSVTISVHDHEWPEVGEWVYKNFDNVGGLSFLPFDTGTYKQTPYETSTKLPKEANVDYSRLPEYEKSDNTTSDKQLACSAGHCEI